MYLHRIKKFMIARLGKLLFCLLILALFSPSLSWAVYNLLSDRTTTWNAGLDSIGGIPTSWANCTTTACNTLYNSTPGDPVTASRINSAITSAIANTVVRIPAGQWTISSSINMKSNVILRGAGSGPPWLPTTPAAGTTTLILSGSALVNMNSSTIDWTPSAPGGTAITAGYAKGSTSLTVANANSPTNYSVGDLILIFQDNDTSVMNIRPGYACDWCPDGQNHMLGQYAKITSKDTSVIGAHVLGIDHGLHYVSPSPTGQSLRRQNSPITMAGIEDMKIRRSSGNSSIIYILNATYCWVKNVETYNAGGSNANAHIDIGGSYACEIRDNYCHTGMGHDSGQNYGIWVNGYWASDIKIENNIVRDTRHAINFEMAGVGCAVLYNYTMDNYENNGGDTSALSSDLDLVHGPWPAMNLVEGNYSINIMLDHQFGGSGYFTLFRNYTRVKRDSPTGYTWGKWGINIEMYNVYANVLGNVVGESTWTTGTVLSNASGHESDTNPVAFRTGFECCGDSPWNANSYSTAIFHGNYDYITKGVASWGWQGGSDHGLRNSMYYASKPSWYGGSVWPPIGPDVSGYFNSIPAKLRYEGSGSGDGGPSSPQNVIVQ